MHGATMKFILRSSSVYFIIHPLEINKYAKSLDDILTGLLTALLNASRVNNRSALYHRSNLASNIGEGDLQCLSSFVNG